MLTFAKSFPLLAFFLSGWYDNKNERKEAADMEELLQAQLNAQRAGVSYAVVTIAEASGSVPRTMLRPG